MTGSLELSVNWLLIQVDLLGFFLFIRYRISLSFNSSTDVVVENGFVASSGAVYTLVIMPNSTAPDTVRLLNLNGIKIYV